ncbi:arginase [Pseudoalteromonas luteoviolacea]|uniref:arginase n=1 Tax=Pseudoalteromonas luteoviolacea TaxID=43657 RepID=UPI001F26D555|nr:arginase [Pseudoalteromonas luteoviolacea]MCF6439063.1 arginase [Pseudoalteromonas luteoviolacea]
MIKDVIVVECDLGGPHSGAALGCRALLAELGDKVNVVDSINVAALPVRQSKLKKAHYLGEINECIDRLSSSIFHFYQNNDSQLKVIAGDHSTASGSLAGLKKAFPDKRIGVVWIDAHADIHSPYTTPSGNVHGMPVAAAACKDHLHRARNELDEQTVELWNNTKALCGESIALKDLVYVGIRDLEQEEWDIVKEENIKYFQVADLNEQGSKRIAHQCLEYLDDCDLLYVSFDIDSLDAKLVPGTGTPVGDGLSVEQAQELLSVLFSSEKLKMFEVVEINPLLDNKNETAKRVASTLIGAF